MVVGNQPAASPDADRLALIVSTQREIAAQGPDLAPVLDLICQRAIELTDSDGAMISLFDGEELVVAAARGAAATTLGSRRPLERSVTFHAFESRTTILIEDSDTDPRINRELQAKVGDRSLICVPLLRGDTPVAALNVLRTSETDRLGLAEVQTLELMAVVLSAAVSRAAEHQAQQEQQAMVARLEAMYTSALVGILTVTPTGEIVDANPAMHKLMCCDAGELVGRTLGAFVHADDRDDVTAQLRRIEAERLSTLRLEHRVTRADWELVWVDVSISVLRDDDGRHRSSIVTLVDVTQRKLAEAQLREHAETNEYLALHDALTGLPNRTLFYDRATVAVEAVRRTGGDVGVLVVDLDGFKEVNDSHGHHAGDEVLVEAGRRLIGVLRTSDTAARLGGDEFAILLPDMPDRAELSRIADRIEFALNAPLFLGGHAVAIRASIGGATFPQDGDDVESVLRAADQAMYSAKHSDRRSAPAPRIV